MRNSRHAIAAVMVVIVIAVVVVAAGVGSYVAFNQTRTSVTSVSSTVAPETTSTSASSFTTSPTTSTMTTTSTSLPSTTTSTSSTSSSTSSVTQEETTIQNFTTILFSTIISESTSNCSLSYNASSLTSLLTTSFPSSLTKNLLGNFSQMSVFLNASSSLGSSQSQSNLTNEVISGSYSTIGTQVINGTTFTLIGIHIDLSIMSTSENESGTVYFNPAWNVTVIDLNGFNFTGSLATQLGSTLMIFFELPFVYNTFETALLQNAQVLHEINQTSVTFGNVTMKVTNYNATTTLQNSTTSISYGCSYSTSVQINASGNGIVQLGTIPGTNTEILTAIVYHETGTSEGITTAANGVFQIKSLTLALPSTSSSSSSTTATTTTSLTSI